MKFAVLGSGSWGTTLANMLAAEGHEVRLWVRRQELFAEMKARNENSWYLPGVELSKKLQLSMDAERTLSGAEAVLIAIPSQFIRPALMNLRDFMPRKPVVVCASKGIELNSLATMSEVVTETLGHLKPRYAMLSGPSFAFEVSRGMPTAVALGCSDKKLGREVQVAMSNDYFRVYTNPDYRGVELGGAIKNIIAIAAGIADGLSFGSNARAALITRGLAEMSRLGQAMGADPRTFMGLAGMGDLVLTCTGELSRNRQVGLRLGQGHKLLDILGQMKMVAEGVKTTDSVHALGEKLSVELPITQQVHQVLYKDKDPHKAVSELMGRELKQEI